MIVNEALRYCWSAPTMLEEGSKGGGGVFLCAL